MDNKHINEQIVHIHTDISSITVTSSTACVPRFALLYWCTWFMKQVPQVSQGYVLYIFKCMIFFSKRNFFRIVFHKMMMYFNFTYLKICSVLWKKTCLIFKLLCLVKHIYFFLLAWADLSKQNENFPLFGSYETPNADKTITWKIWISYWKRKAVLTTNAKKFSAQKVYEKYERWQKMRRISFNGLECFVMMKWFGQTLICRYGQRTHSPKYTYIDFIVFPL